MSMRAVPWPEPDPVVAAAIRAKYAGRRVPLAVAVLDALLAKLAADGLVKAGGSSGLIPRCLMARAAPLPARASPRACGAWPPHRG